LGRAQFLFFLRQQAAIQEMPPAARCATLKAYKKAFAATSCQTKKHIRMLFYIRWTL